MYKKQINGVRKAALRLGSTYREIHKKLRRSSSNELPVPDDFESSTWYISYDVDDKCLLLRNRDSDVKAVYCPYKECEVHISGATACRHEALEEEKVRTAKECYAYNPDALYKFGFDGIVTERDIFNVINAISKERNLTLSNISTTAKQKLVQSIKEQPYLNREMNVLCTLKEEGSMTLRISSLDLNYQLDKCCILDCYCIGAIEKDKDSYCIKHAVSAQYQVTDGIIRDVMQTFHTEGFSLEALEQYDGNKDFFARLWNAGINGLRSYIDSNVFSLKLTPDYQLCMENEKVQDSRVIVCPACLHINSTKDKSCEKCRKSSRIFLLNILKNQMYGGDDSNFAPRKKKPRL